MKQKTTKKEIEDLYKQSKDPKFQQDAEAKLWAIQFTSLDIDARVELHYFLGRILSREENPNLKTRERINAYFTDAIAISKHYGHPISGKLYFVTANYKFELATVFEDNSDRLSLIIQAKQLTVEGLSFYPNNSSLNGLKIELSK